MKFIPITAKREGLITLQQVFEAATRSGKAIIPIKGDCMEGADIEDGGRVAVDFTHYPRPGRWEGDKYVRGDACMCYAQAPSMSEPAIMCKVYDGVWMGHMVGTQYKWHNGKGRMNGGFSAVAILGVVYASWGRDGQLLWEYDPATYPTKLPTEITIKGGNIDPLSVLVPVKEAQS